MSDDECLPDECPECETELVEAPAIGHYCPNQSCGVGDGPFGKTSQEDQSEIANHERDSDLPEVVTHAMGFTKIEGSRFNTESGTTQIRIDRQKRMHKFRSGYQDTGPKRTMFLESEDDARVIYKMLKEFFDDE